jgi:glycosyltransferase involved in cell wall biosynthesis
VLKKKILLIIPNLGRGGAQKVFHQQLKYLSDDFDVTGCVFNWDGAFGHEREMNIVSLEVPAGKTYLGKVWCFISRIRRLRKLKREKGVDVSISHLEGADYINILSRTHDKIFCWIHGTKKLDGNIEGSLGWLRRNVLMPVLYRRCDLLVSVSDSIRRELVLEFGVSKEKVKYIPNGFDFEVIKKLSHESVDARLFPILTGGNILVTHCRLSRQKNLESLLTIFAKVRANKNTKLLILGDGELREQLLQHAKGIGLRTFAFWKDQDLAANKDVYFLGYFDNPYSILAQSSVYLMTSSWEGFPLALCEAMVCGVAVLTADCFTGPREIVAPDFTDKQPVKKPVFLNTGVLMPLASAPDELEIWSQTVERLLDDRHLLTEVKTSAKKRILDFDISNIHKEWLKIIKE